jgi:hypothetical protein
VTRTPLPSRPKGLDPCVRLPLHEADRLTCRHLHSEILEPEDPAARAYRGTCGITEWIADGARTLSFGWVWFYAPGAGGLQADWDSLSTNLLLVDEHGRDMPDGQLRRWFRQHIAAANWAAVVVAALLPDGLPLH